MTPSFSSTVHHGPIRRARPRRPLLMAAAATLTGALLAAGCAPSNSDSASTGTAAGAGGSGGGAASADGPVTLTVWSWRVEDTAAYRKIFDAYQSKNPGVTVNFKAFKATEYNQILATGLSGSDGPDVPQVRSYGQLQATLAAKSLVPLDDTLDLKGWDPTIVASAKGKADGKLYAVPFAQQSVQLYYNQDVFSANGIKPPTTWKEFQDACAKLKQAGVTPLAIGGKDDWTLPIVHEAVAASRFGGKEFAAAAASGKKNFTDPNWTASIQTVADLKQYMPDGVTGVPLTDAVTLFATGRAAIFPGGSYDLAMLKAANPDLKLGVFQMPVVDGSPAGATPTTAGWADGNFGVNAKSKNVAAAKKLVKWMSTKEFGQLVVDEIKQVSAVPGVTFSDPVMKQMSDFYAKNPSPYFLLTDFRYGTPSGGELFTKGMVNVLLGKQSPAQVGTDMDKGIAAWFKPQQ